MKLDRPFTNVILSAVAFMLIFSAFQTMVNIEQTILKSITKPSFTADAFISSGIVYAVFALANWVSPSVIAVIGPKFTMVIGGVMYLYVSHCIMRSNICLNTSVISLIKWIEQEQH